MEKAVDSSGKEVKSPITKTGLSKIHQNKGTMHRIAFLSAVFAAQMFGAAILTTDADMGFIENQGVGGRRDVVTSHLNPAIAEIASPDGMRTGISTAMAQYGEAEARVTGSAQQAGLDRRFEGVSGTASASITDSIYFDNYADAATLRFRSFMQRSGGPNSGHSSTAQLLINGEEDTNGFGRIDVPLAPGERVTYAVFLSVASVAFDAPGERIASTSATFRLGSLTLLDSAGNPITSTVHYFTESGAQYQFDNASFGGTASAVPEPSAFLLIGSAGMVIACYRLRQRLQSR